MSLTTDEKDLFSLATPMQLKQMFLKQFSRIEATDTKVLLYVIKPLSFKTGKLHPRYLLGMVSDSC